MQVHQTEATYEQSEEMEGKKEEKEDKETERKRCPTHLGGINQRNHGWEGTSNVYDMIYIESENYPSPNSTQTKVQKGRWSSPSLMAPAHLH